MYQNKYLQIYCKSDKQEKDLKTHAQCKKHIKANSLQKYTLLIVNNAEVLKMQLKILIFVCFVLCRNIKIRSFDYLCYAISFQC